MHTKRTIGRKIFRVLLWSIGGIVVLLIIAIGLLVSPPGKRIVRNELLSFLRKKLHTRVELAAIEYELPKMVGLKGLLLEDQLQDTLLSVGTLKVDIDLLKLLNSKISVNDLVLEDVVARAYRNKPDTLYNFSYIIQAFAGAPDSNAVKKEDTGSGTSFVFDVGTVRLQNIRVDFSDGTGGTDLHANLRKLELRMRELDPAKMVFRLKSVQVDGLYARFAQDTSLIPADTTSSDRAMTLALDKLSLKNIDFAFSGKQTHTDFSIALKNLSAEPEEIDLQKQKIRIKTLLLEQPDIVFAYKSTPGTQTDTLVPGSDSAAFWDVALKQLRISQLAFRLDDSAQAPLRKGMDYAHLNVQNLDLNADNLQYTPAYIAGNIRHAALSEHQGLQLQELKTSFYYSDTGARLSGLVLRTPATYLQRDIRIAYRSLSQLQQHPDSMYVFLDMPDSRIAMTDVLLFVPQLDTMARMRSLKQQTIYVDALWDGYLSGLNLRRTRILAGSNTRIDIEGRLDGLPDSKRLRYALNVRQLKSSRNDIQPFLPPASAQNFRLPDVFNISGRISGTTLDYYPDLILSSSDGSARVKGLLKMSGAKNHEEYKLQVQTRALNIGRLLRKDTLMGPVTASIQVAGHSFDPKSMSAKVEGAIQSAFIKGYAYRDVRFDGNMNEQQGSLNLLSNDPNARLQMKANADLRKQFAAVYAQVNVDSIDFYALQLAAAPMRFQGSMNADVPVLNPDYPQGDVVIRNPVVATAGSVYTVDSLYIQSHPDADSGQQIRINFDFFQGYLSGKTPLRAIAPAITEHINRHYLRKDSVAKQPVAVKDTAVPSSYTLNMQASLFPTPFIQAFLPQLQELDTVHLNAALNEQILRLDVDAKRVVYGAQQMDGLSVRVNERDSAFTYAVILDRFAQGNIQLLQTELNGRVDTNLITAAIKTHDAAGKERFRLGASLYARGTEQTLSINPDMMLDYRNWTVAQPNKLVIGPEGMYAQNIALSGNGAEISLNSERPEFRAPMQVRISNFNIADIMQMVSGDTLFASGIINGTATLREMKPNLLFDADMKVSQLAFLNDTVGDVVFTAANDAQQQIKTHIALSGNGNDLVAEGTYYPVPANGNNFDLGIDIRSLNIRSLEGIAQHQIKESSGGIKGQLRLRGTTAKPLIEGALTTQELQTTVTSLNARFRMPSETISFSADGISFDHFKILDSAGNVASIDGKVTTTDLNNLSLSMVVDAKNWKALSSAKGDNDLFYGSLILTTHLNIEGPIRQPSVNGSINIQKGTNLTIVLPESGTSLEDQAGVIVFVDQDHPARIKPLPVKDTVVFARLAPGSDINVNLTTDENAEFNVIIDQSTGDFLSVRGKAQINTSMDRGGSLTMNGIYELSSGAYQLNYNLIKRKFDISKGSTITFAGDPLDAEMNITAVYKANVAPYDLVERQVPDPAQLIYYRQALPFQVALHMNGPIMTPLLNFDILLPENQTYRLSSDAIQIVQAKLSQLRIDTSELNKQVFALLILKRFITDDPFSSNSGSTAEFAAKQSVSRFIGEQLNQVANQLLNGVDLSVDLASTEDYTTGARAERTDLSIAASKRLFNDRLKVTIGNNFELEGPQTKTNNTNSSLIPGNLAVDYSLSADNRYSIRAYRQSLDQGVIQGFVTETGLNFIVTYDYNRFRTLFMSRKKMEEQRKRRQSLRNTTTKK